MFNVQSSTMTRPGFIGSLNKKIMSEGLMSEGLMSEGLMSENLMSEGLMSEGLMSEGQMSEGLTSDYHHITALKYQEGPRFEPRHFHYF